jgi:hypothetical protein
MDAFNDRPRRERVAATNDIFVDALNAARRQNLINNDVTKCSNVSIRFVIGIWGILAGS